MTLHIIMTTPFKRPCIGSVSINYKALAVILSRKATIVPPSPCALNSFPFAWALLCRDN
nr:MAG TPA: hypothetical protein [Bacteriophage sp.]